MGGRVKEISRIFPKMLPIPVKDEADLTMDLTEAIPEEIKKEYSSPDKDEGNENEFNRTETEQKINLLHEEQAKSEDKSGTSVQIDKLNKRMGSHSATSKNESDNGQTKHSLEGEKAINPPLFIYECDRCSHKAYRRDNFIKHVLRHSRPVKPARLRRLPKEPKIRCTLCSYSSVRELNFQKHMQKHIKPDPPKTIAREIITSEKEGRNTREKKSLKCQFCGFEARRKENFRRHKKKHARSLRAPNRSAFDTIACDTCGFESQRREKFMAHFQRNNHLNAIFQQKGDEKIKREVGIKPDAAPETDHHLIYGCHICSFKTLRTDRMTQHLTTHFEQKPKPPERKRCHLCPYSTTKETKFEEHLQKHVRAEVKEKARIKRMTEKALQKTERPRRTLSLKCDICGFEANRAKSEYSHRARHRGGSLTGANRYRFDIMNCDTYEFESNSQLIFASHSCENPHLGTSIFEGKNQLFKIKVEPDNKPDTASETDVRPSFECQICSYRVLSTEEMVKHMDFHSTKTTTDNNSKNCSLCSYRTNSDLWMAKHMQRNAETERERREMLKKKAERQKVSLTCSICGFKSNRMNNAYRHRARHMRKSKGPNRAESDSMLCETCDFETRKREVFMAHFQRRRHLNGTLQERTEVKRDVVDYQLDGSSERNQTYDSEVYSPIYRENKEEAPFEYLSDTEKEIAKLFDSSSDRLRISLEKDIPVPDQNFDYDEANWLDEASVQSHSSSSTDSENSNPGAKVEDSCDYSEDEISTREKNGSIRSKWVTRFDEKETRGESAIFPQQHNQLTFQDQLEIGSLARKDREERSPSSEDSSDERGEKKESRSENHETVSNNSSPNRDQLRSLAYQRRDERFSRQQQGSGTRSISEYQRSGWSDFEDESQSLFNTDAEDCDRTKRNDEEQSHFQYVDVENSDTGREASIVEEEKSIMSTERGVEESENDLHASSHLTSDRGLQFSNCNTILTYPIQLLRHETACIKDSEVYSHHKDLGAQKKEDPVNLDKRLGRQSDESLNCDLPGTRNDRLCSVPIKCSQCEFHSDRPEKMKAHQLAHNTLPDLRTGTVIGQSRNRNRWDQMKCNACGIVIKDRSNFIKHLSSVKCKKSAEELKIRNAERLSAKPDVRSFDRQNSVKTNSDRPEEIEAPISSLSTLPGLRTGTIMGTSRNRNKWDQMKCDACGIVTKDRSNFMKHLLSVKCKKSAEELKMKNAERLSAKADVASFDRQNSVKIKSQDKDLTSRKAEPNNSSEGVNVVNSARKIEEFPRNPSQTFPIEKLLKKLTQWHI